MLFFNNLIDKKTELRKKVKKKLAGTKNVLKFVPVVVG